jgi:hypothetical protein
LKGFYLHVCAAKGVNDGLRTELSVGRLPTKADRSRALLGHVRTSMPANPLAPTRGTRRRHPKMLPDGARPELLEVVNTARDEMVVTWLSDTSLRAGLGWDGEMRHLPSVGVPTDRTATEPCLIVKQDNNGATFVICANSLSWAEAGCVRVEDVRPRRIGAFTHPTAEEIREAMSDILPPRLYHSEWDNDAF